MFIRDKRQLAMKPAHALAGIVLLLGGATVAVLNDKPAELKSEVKNETTFAEIIDGTVRRVIVADQAFIDSGAVGDPKNWIETSDKKNYPAMDYVYDKERDAFIPPKPEGATIFDEEKAKWNEPIKTHRATST